MPSRAEGNSALSLSRSRGQLDVLQPSILTQTRVVCDDQYFGFPVLSRRRSLHGCWLGIPFVRVAQSTRMQCLCSLDLKSASACSMVSLAQSMMLVLGDQRTSMILSPSTRTSRSLNCRIKDRKLLSLNF